jgi:hypothetical protein
MFREPVEHLRWVLVGREDRVEGVLDPAVGHDQRQPFVEPPAAGGERREVECFRELVSGVGQDRERKPEALGDLGPVGSALRREPVDGGGAGGAELAASAPVVLRSTMCGISVPAR